MRGEVQFTCPFCKLTVYASRDGYLVHQAPACSKYMHLEPLEYMIEANKKLGLAHPQ